MIETVEKVAISRGAKLLPGETPEAAMGRRIRMHEFLMTGGVQMGRNKDGMMVYSGPITVADYPVCPWHGEDCLAWDEIVAGRGHWTRIERELAEAEDEMTEPITTEEAAELEERITNLRTALEFRPRDALALRERSDEQIAAEKAEVDRRRAKRFADLDKLVAAAREVAGEVIHDLKSAPRVYAKAGPKTGGNPWDKGGVNRKTGEIYDDHAPMWAEPKKDARNDAVAAFATEDLPDTIEVDGDEGEEGDE